MSHQTSLFVHSLSVAGRDDGSTSALPQRELPGWGVMHAVQCVADTALLMVADKLLIDPAWFGGAGDVVGLFRDAEHLVEALIERGAAALVPVGPGDAPSGRTADELVAAALQDFEPWLGALGESAKEWATQEGLADGVWNVAQPQAGPWRDMLRSVGLSSIKHNYRNRSQAFTALASLVQWRSAKELEPELVRDAMYNELAYVFSTIKAAANAGAIVHEWSDMAPLYVHAAGTPDPFLVLRLPGLSAEPAQRAVDVLTGAGLDAGRRLVAAAIAGESVPAAQIEKSVLEAVPREARTPYAYRQVSLYRVSQQAALDLGLAQNAVFAISKWRASGLGQD